MTATALALVLVAAVLHAVWNLLAKRAGGGAILVWIYGTVSAALLTPAAVAFLVLRPLHLGLPQFTFMFASALIHVVYFVVLQRGYQLGDLSLVYPIARGTGPVLTMIAAVALLGERPSVLAIAGAGLVAAGVFALVKPAGAATVDSGRATAFGLLTGVLIAAYTVCDKLAVSRYAVPPLIQQWAACLSVTALLAPRAIRSRSEVRAQWRSHRREAIAIGILVPAGYILVLAAMTISPVSYIAPAREVSILFGTIMGTHFLEEGRPGPRIAAASAMVVGLVALALG